MRRSLAGLILGVLAVLALGAAVAQSADRSVKGRSSVVVHSVQSRDHLRAFWTPKRIRTAEPASLLTFSRPGGRLVQADDGSPAAADPSADGTDTGDSTLFPNRANGIVLFFYGPDEFVCSGSVINTSVGNVVLTAGHCVIDPGPGTQATDIVFIPGYRDGAEPFGEWPATSFATTPQWESTAGTGDPSDADEAGDMAMLTLANRPGDGATIQSVVGAVGIGFNQVRNQTYMEYGYPAEFPYDGSRLYELTSPFAGNDPSFTPATMAISSDFTGGSSGGPWLVGSGLAALSVSDYTYSSVPGYMFGPYFGNIAQNLFVSVGGSASGSSAMATAGTAQPTSAAAPKAPSNAFTIEFLTRNRRRGRAVLGVRVAGAGVLVIKGNDLRRATKTPSGGQIVKLPVRADDSARADLRDKGRLRVRAKIVYTPSGGSANRKNRDLTLIRRP